ncbi:MAG: C10 family peptidase [Deltaproteobacteria bacterium]|nr:C10 family peptidase [Deltaproteobacteria bacterium]
MWLKNGVKRFFEIALVTLFLFFLLGNLPYARAQEQEWHWGLENCTIGACPEGLAGPFFFQYGNKWASYKEVKFQGWESEEKLGQAWCFLGSIATIILYHEYPRESHFFDVPWFSGKNVMIDHVWKYADIKNLSGVGGIDCWYQDNPETRDITGCRIAGYCRAADEIRRLFGAITAALGLSSPGDYGCVFSNPTECIPDMMRDDFGYLSESIEPIDGKLTGTNKQKLIESLNTGYPVIVVGDGHAWVLDGYRDNNGDEFHILNFGCGDSHKSYWIKDPVSDGVHYSAKAFIINLRPMDATPITATAEGSQTPKVDDPPFTDDPMVKNGDFTITPDGFDPGHTQSLGDGVNEGTSWRFDFIADPEFQFFSTSLPLASALLTLELTPKGSGISTDAFKINIGGFLPIITPVIQELPIGVTSTIQIELNNFYRNRALPDLLKATHGNSIPAFYADDAIVSFAELTLTSFPGEKVNDRFPDLGPEDVDTDFDVTPCAENCVGTFTITAEFKNTSSDTLSDLFFEVVDLTGGNVLCNADGGVPWGYGADLTVPMDGELKSQESFTVVFEIGLRSMRPFIFKVDLFGKVQK